MIDFYLRASSKEVMHAAMRATYENLAQTTLPENAPTPFMGKSVTGTSWYVDEIGEFYDATDPDHAVPLPGYHIILRWNGADDIPPVPAPLEVIWRSDAVDEEGNGVPPPAWWNRRLA